MWRPLSQVRYAPGELQPQARRDAGYREPPAHHDNQPAQHAGGWGGAAIGSALAEALGAAFICTGTGPGAFFCMVAVGIGGGLVGDTAGRPVAQQVNEGITTLKEPGRLMEALVSIKSAISGDDTAKQYCEQREAVTGQPPIWP